MNFHLPLVEAIGEERTGIRFSPFGVFQDIGDATPYDTWGHLLKVLQLKHPNLSYAHSLDARDITIDKNVETENTLDPFRKQWNGVFISAGPYIHDVQSAFDTAEKHGDLIAFGRSFIAKPDLAECFRNGWPLNKYNRSTFYGTPGGIGYTDYPFYKNEVLKK